METRIPVAAERKAPRTVWAWTAGTFCGAGLLRPGPGTWGSVAATALWYFGLRAAHLSSWTAVAVTVAGAGVVTLIGIPAATIVARESGREDPGHVVIDEVAGQLIALISLPATPLFAVMGLLLFRLFDIWKPWPVRKLEQLPGGTGIMMDDVAAGVLALVAAYLISAGLMMAGVLGR